jgi:hypothetical protein
LIISVWTKVKIDDKLFFCTRKAHCSLRFDTVNTETDLTMIWYTRTLLWIIYECVFKSFRTESITKTATTNTRWEATHKGYGTKTH